jgi:hypothetical protein
MKKSAPTFLQSTAQRIIETGTEFGFKVVFEEDQPDIQDFFLVGERLIEEAFRALELVLLRLVNPDGSEAGLEFHVFFFAMKGRKLQRRLRQGDFLVLKAFLEGEFFDKAGLSVLEYDPVQRDYRDALHFPSLFPTNQVGVTIQVGGWLTNKATAG